MGGGGTKSERSEAGSGVGSGATHEVQLLVSGAQPPAVGA